jgi:predicted acyltransferase
MFIVGVAMPFSFSRRWNRGETWNSTFRHALKRSLLLLLLGWALYCIGPGKITFHFTNVLAQLSVSYLIAFLIMRKAVKWQLVISLALILMTDLLYRFWPAEGFNQPFVVNHNFGSWFDLTFFGSLAGGGWVAFNAIPTAAHTIWGVIAGMVLMTEWTQRKKIQTLLFAGIFGIILGFALDPYVPIIKRTCTSSFIFVSGGWAFIGLALSYWLIDVLKFRKGLLIFTVVGMNPLFIYLFAHIGGANLIESIFKPFVDALFAWGGKLTVEIVLSTMVWFSLWYICYFMYKRKVFIKL